MSPSPILIIHWLARCGLCVAFIYSGISKLLDFQSAIAEQAHFGLSPPALFAVAAIATQLGGSALMLFWHGPLAALGALALAGFTLLATFIGHPFWHETGMERFADLNAFLEHFGLIGGFVLVILWELRIAVTRTVFISKTGANA
ncbi:MAG: DoxX family protein [Nevskia sp.]|nr:DoxX family protein [Nevskia sp.]